jgi:DNA-binding XRE family transcriptional regulator
VPSVYALTVSKIRERVAALIRTLGSQTDVALLLGISQNTVSGLHTGKLLDVSISTCRKMILATRGRTETECITADDCCELADLILADRGTGPPRPRLAAGGRGDEGGTKGESSRTRDSRRKSDRPPAR